MSGVLVVLVVVVVEQRRRMSCGDGKWVEMDGSSSDAGSSGDDREEG